MNKQCKKCGLILPEDRFSKNGKYTRNDCKTCEIGRKKAREKEARRALRNAEGKE